MFANSDDYKAYIQLVQIYNACSNSNSNEKNIEEILKKTSVNINHQIPSTTHVDQNKSSCKSYFQGNTFLHFAFNTERFEIFNFLLTNYADYTRQNSKGCTVLHESIQSNHQHYTDSRKLTRQFHCPYVKSILSAHVKDKNWYNPIDNNGLSHFHGACMVNNVDAVELFLKNGVPVDQSVNVDSPYFAGYTALHFAVRCGSLETFRILLQSGANVHLNDAKGMNPLELLVEQSMNMTEWISTGKALYHKSLSDDMKANEEMIEAIITLNTSENTKSSCFNVALALLNTSKVENILKQYDNLDYSIQVNSAISPGYTIAHFAAIFNANTLKLLLKNGATLESTDANGTTVLDMCLEKYDTLELHSILSCQSTWQNVLMSDGKSKLLDVILSMRNPQEFEVYLDKSELNINSFVLTDSSPWVGYTLLHLAVTLSEKLKQRSNYSPHVHAPLRQFKPSLEIIKKCLERGVSITTQDRRGITALQLAFRQSKVNSVDLLLNHLNESTNINDDGGLSHLHIACAAKCPKAVEILLSSDANVNERLRSDCQWYSGQQYRSVAGGSSDLKIKSGSTPLHIAVQVENVQLADILLQHGADVYAKDDDGKTPIHLIVAMRRPNVMADRLLSTLDLREVVSDKGLAHLHVATLVNDFKTVEKLLDQGVDVNIVHHDSSIYYAGCNPLAIALEKNCANVVPLLIQRGADIFAKIPGGSRLLYRYVNGYYLNYFVERLKQDDVSRIFMQEDSGVTMLHIACYSYDIEAVRSLLESGVNVNEKTHEDSALWPGSTALHVLMIAMFRDNREGLDKNMMQLLLDHGADVTLPNSQMDTPLHVAAKNSFYGKNQDYPSLLLKYHKSFNVNPKSSENVSHFHLACLANDLNAVEEFLKFGVDANESTDHSSMMFYGCSPLHLTLRYQCTDIIARLKIVDRLIENGADVDAEDAHGKRPLHHAADCCSIRLDLLKKFISAGADIQAKDTFGKTPFEVVLNSNNNCTVEELQFFLENGYSLNIFNPIYQTGYLALIFSKHNDLWEYVLKTITDNPNLIKHDDQGRSILHNIVSNSNCVKESCYTETFRKLIKLGLGIDDQDVQGKTPLHVAASYGNLSAVCALLNLGADVNINDANGYTAFSHTLEAHNKCEADYKYGYPDLIDTFVTHMRFLEICGLFIDKVNVDTQKNTPEGYSAEEEKVNRFIEKMEKLKNIKIGKMVASSFLSEMEAVNGYISVSESDRCDIDAFFQTIDEKDLNEVKCVLNLHYRKALARLNSMEQD